MSAELKKIAAEVVKRAKKRAVLAEVTALVKRAVAYGMDADQKSQQITPKGPAGIPAPARMKSPPTAPAKPEVAPLPPKVAADMLMAGLLVKTAEQIKTARAVAYKRAAVFYAKAAKSGNKEHIKKATAYLANVITFDTMTKQALTGQIGSLIMRLLSKITPAAGYVAKKLGRGGDTAEKVMKWGQGLGEKGQHVKGMLEAGKGVAGPGWLAKLLQSTPGAAGEINLAKNIGTGALAGAGGLAAGSVLS